MQRIAIIGEGPTALSTAEKLISAGMCVDLITQCTAPFGLLRRFAGLAGVLGDAVTGSHCGSGTTPRLRLIGNVHVGAEGDITQTKSTAWPPLAIASYSYWSSRLAAWQLPLGKDFAPP